MNEPALSESGRRFAWLAPTYFAVTAGAWALAGFEMIADRFWLSALAGLLAAPWSVLYGFVWLCGEFVPGGAKVTAIYIPLCGALNGYLIRRRLKTGRWFKPRTSASVMTATPAAIPLQRTRSLAVAAWCLLAIQAVLFVLIAASAIHEHGSRSIGAAIIAFFVAPPIALGGIVLACVLLFNRRQRRRLLALILLTVSIVMLFGEAPLALGNVVADHWWF